MSSGEKGAVMGEVGVHIEAKRGRGRLRDGGASQEYMFFFPVKGSRGQRVQSGMAATGKCVNTDKCMNITPL